MAVRELAIAGWTARDGASRHFFYRAASARLTHSDAIEVSGANSTGEAKFVLVESGGRLWAGVGSDHTDLGLERYDIAAAKQICEKPLAGGLWLFAEIQDHWNDLALRSWLVRGKDRELYQEGSVKDLVQPAELISAYANGGSTLPDNTLIFGGAPAPIGGIRPAERFEFELEDPVRRRSLRHDYGVRVLPSGE